MAIQAARYDREVKRLKAKAASALRKMKSAQRSKQRIQKKMDERYSAKKSSQHALTNKTPVNPQMPKTTPRSSARSLLDRAVASPKRGRRSLARRLTYLTTLEQSVQKAAAVSTQTKGTLLSLLSSGMQKSRQEVPFSRSLGVHARRIRQHTSPTTQLPKKQREPARRAALRETVINYLSEDEQSRQNPGKKDYVLVNGEKVQSRTCTDYMGTLFDRFRAEHPDVTIGRTTFFSLRPPHITKSSALQSFGCLCQTHENTGLLLKSLNSLVETKVSVSPDTFCAKYPEQDSVENILQELDCDVCPTVTIRQWQSILCPEDGKKRTKVCASQVPSATFKEKVLQNIATFRSHAERVKVQFLALKDLKSSLSPHTLIIQMDFAENFNCSAGDRNVQSSYWNPLSVTLHPVIVYFREEVGGDLKKKSLCYVSALNKHNTSMVLSIMKSLLLRDIQELISRLHVTHVHYMTDSPVSQYRNKFLFFTVSNHLSIFGVAASWHYFEKGHGKGPCDGVGGAVKRGAGQAAKHGVPMADATQFFAWAKDKPSEIQFFYVSRLQYDQSAEDIGLIEPRLQPVKNTLSIHHVTGGSGMGEVKWRETSCNCEGCLASNTTCAYTTASVVKPLPARRPKRKLQGQLFTSCSSCENRILCSCLDRAPQTSPVDITPDTDSSDDDLPLFRQHNVTSHVSHYSDSDESDAYVDIDVNHPSDADVQSSESDSESPQAALIPLPPTPKRTRRHLRRDK